MSLINAFDKIADYIRTTPGLQHEVHTGHRLRIQQKIDGKIIFVDGGKVENVLDRTDADGKSFIQINFLSGSKILLTDQLIGFKPLVSGELDMSKLPNVVTTPDLGSVFEAIQEAMSEDAGEEDVEVLKRVFECVIQGGEAVGFDLAEERGWLQRLVNGHSRASA